MTDPWNHPALWHAINVHLPVVLALLGLPIVCWIAITRGRNATLRWLTVLLYVLLTASAAYAIITGEHARADLPTLTSAAGARINFHEWMAEKVWPLAAGTAFLLLLSNIPRRWARQTFMTLSLVGAVTTAGWVIVTGHSGGVAVYQDGLGTMALKSSAGAPSTQPITPVPPLAVSQAVAPDSVSYARQIKPLLQSKCESCHSGENPKSGFETTSIAKLMAKGKKAGAGVVAGKPDESAIIQYVTGKREPRMPKGKPALDDSQVELLRKWIAAGAVDDSGSLVVSAIAAPTAKPQAAAVTTQPISAEWDPQVPWSAAESVAVRRYERLKFLPKPPQVPKVSVPTTNPIDNFIAAKWERAASAKPQAATQPVPEVCDDATFVRRAFLDLIGFIPSAEEARHFVEDKEPSKRAKLIDALLDRKSDYAGNWVPFWEDALCSNGLHQGGVGTHGNYRKWIFDSFAGNKPYDLMVQELLDPTVPGHPVRYVLNDNHFRTVQSAADTAQVFLGTAIKCASCHNHFLNDEWPQARAVAFAGYFASKDMEVIRCEHGTGEFVQTHFMFDLPKAPTSAPADQGQRLKRVAQLITDPTNPRFAKTIVNRLWKRYMGLGLFEPADDYRPDVPGSNPELLDWLANDFVRHGYDIRHTVALIANSRTYQLKYNPKVADRFDVEKPGEPRFFRSPALRRLTAEQLLDSINVAVNQRVLGDARTYNDDSSTPLTRSLGRPATRNEVATARPEDTAVVQSLELLNGQEFHDRVYKGQVVSVLAATTQPSQVVDELYWSVHGRAPSEKEKERSVAYLKSAPKPATTQPVEIVWVDDAVPPGATARGQWIWAPKTAQPVFSGKLSHTDGETEPIATQHLFVGSRMTVNPGDTLFTYVFIDPQNVPQEIMLQFNAGDWLRAYWGADAIPFKPAVAMGSLPKAGEWVKLEIPAAKLGIDKATVINGVSFDQFLGKVYWDKTGISKGPAVNDPEAIGDMIWALLSSPEFQYIR